MNLNFSNNAFFAKFFVYLKKKVCLALKKIELNRHVYKYLRVMFTQLSPLINRLSRDIVKLPI